MKKKLEYWESGWMAYSVLPEWKCLHDRGYSPLKLIYLERNNANKQITFFV